VATRFNSTTGGNWNSTSSWATTNGGAGPASFPVAGDTVNITGSGANITVNVSSACGDLTITGATLAGSAALACNGNVSLGGTITYSGTLTLNATATGKTFASNGKTFPGNITVNGVGGGWTQSDALLCSGTVTETNGAFSDGGFTLTAAVFSSNNSNTRSITKAAQWTITGTGTCVNLATVSGLTWSGSGGWSLTNSSATARTFATGGLTFGGTLAVSAGSGSFIINGNGTFGGVNFTGFSGSLDTGNWKSSSDVVLSATMTSTDNASVVRLVPTVGTTANFTSNGVTFNRILNLEGAGTVKLLDAMSLGVGSKGLNLNAGTLDINGKNASADTFAAATATCNVINAGAATLTLTGAPGSTNVVSILPSLCTINYSDMWSEIHVTDVTSATKTINTSFAESSGGFHYKTLRLSAGAGGGTYVINGDNTIDSLIVEATAPCSVQLRDGRTHSIGLLTTPQAAGREVAISSTVAGSRASLVNTGGANITTDYVSMKDCSCGPGYSWFVGNHSVNGGNNLGVAFCSPANASMMALAA
jgi:hypothetical protein